ncbi:MAG: hypothetical protein K2M76_07005 [Muribaculaceae bacterium]|nr:hypothetical protein [Muribaculaceae bacterium]
MGVYRPMGIRYSLAVEGYMKWMHNLIDYRDEYYLIPPQQAWQSQLTAGKGTAKGLDVKLVKEAGKLTGHVGYSLMWADRTFADRNGGRTYPARFDNRHKINVALNWRPGGKWEINAAWTGMSGNRCTLPTQMWVGPDGSEVPLVTDVNNYRLPFYHRLDLSFIRHTRRGYWTFSIFNAYSHMNVVTARRGTVYDYTLPWEERIRPVFEHFKLLPIIPTFSYTWKF